MTHLKVVRSFQTIAAESLAKIRAERDNPTIDVWLTTGSLPYLLAQDGLLYELTDNKVPNIKDILPAAVGMSQGKKYWAGIHLVPRGLVADVDKLKKLIPDFKQEMLKSWEILYRPELKDNIVLLPWKENDFDSTVVFTVPYGGSAENLDAVINAWKKLAPNVHALGGLSVTEPLFINKGIAIALTGYSPSIVALTKTPGRNIVFEVPTNPLHVLLDYVCAIKNGPARDGGELAFKFINRLIDAKVQSAYVKDISNLSPNIKAIQPTYEHLPNISPEEYAKKTWTIPFEIQIKNNQAWTERWRREIQPILGK